MACSAGLLDGLVERRRTHGEVVAAYLAGKGGGGDGGWLPVWSASLNGRLAVVEWLVGEVGASPGAVRPSDGASAVFIAVQNGHLEMVRKI